MLTSQAQETATHAHATSRHWKGIDVDKVIKSDDNDTEFETNGKKIYMYNVGTGRFIIEGGNWGVEGRLFHEDFGRKMTLMPTGRINSGITENNISSSKNNFVLNIPNVNSNYGWDKCDRYSYTTIMDGNVSICTYNSWPGYNKPRHWDFYRVETDPSADTYTYYMAEHMPDKNGVEKDYWLGAAWGEWHYKNKGDGLFIYLDEDRSVWTSAEVRGNTEKKEVNGEMITIDELYQWRIISEEEFITVLNEEVIGLNPSISSLIPDRDFSRNSDDLVKWVTERNANGDYTANGRLGYTWGLTTKDYRSLQKMYNDGPWNEPIRLQETFDDKNGGTTQEGLTNSKYCFLSFEGVRRVHTSFEVLNPGWYMVQCYGFCQSDTNDGYLYAKVEDGNGASSYGGFEKENLERIPSGSYSKDTRSNCLEVGKELLVNGESHKTSLWICVTEEEFTNDHKTLQIGVGKDAATQSAGTVNNGITYYYDTDWVCIDDFRVSYMGLGPVFFYEEEESLEYLTPSPDNEKQYLSATPNGRYS